MKKTLMLLFGLLILFTSCNKEPNTSIDTSALEQSLCCTTTLFSTNQPDTTLPFVARVEYDHSVTIIDDDQYAILWQIFKIVDKDTIPQTLWFPQWASQTLCETPNVNYYSFSPSIYEGNYYYIIRAETGLFNATPPVTWTMCSRDEITIFYGQPPGVPDLDGM